jgi:DNA-binding FadR family transcriptional regulator
LGKQHGYETKNGIRVVISQEEVARFLGLSRQVVNQHLRNWKAKGWVDLGRGKMTIVDEKAMQRIAAAI